MQPGRRSDAVRQASGLPHLSVLKDPLRVARVQEITGGVADWQAKGGALVTS